MSDAVPSLASGQLTPTDFIRIQQAPVPHGGQAFYLGVDDKAYLRVAKFAANTPKATILLLHGRCEFMEKYFATINRMRSKNFNVVTMDWRGQGMSSRQLPQSQKGYIKSFDTYVTDIERVVEIFLKPSFSGPYFGLAHSMGSVPLLLHLCKHQSPFSGAVFSAPLTRIAASPFKRLFFHFLAHASVYLGAGKKSIIGHRTSFERFEENTVTHCQAQHELFQQLQEAAPHAAIHAPTYAWFKALMQATARLNKASTLRALKIPVMIINGSEDDKVDITNTARLATKNNRIKEILIEGARHEMMHESSQFLEKFWSAFDHYMTDHLTYSTPQAVESS